MTHSLAKALKDNGYPLKNYGDSIYMLLSSSESEPYTFKIDERLYIWPTLFELIEACGPVFYDLVLHPGGGRWHASDELSIYRDGYSASGSTPEEAVAKLWLAIHRK